MRLFVEIEKDIDLKEFGKCISFVSESIVSYKFIDKGIELEVKDDVEKEYISETVLKMVGKYVTVNKDENVIANLKQEINYMSDIIEDERLFFKFQDGVYGLKGKAIWLQDFFEKSFEEIALKLGAIKRKYPIMLPVSQYKKTGYLKNSPQYAIFCCNVHENINELEQLDNIVENESVKEKLNKPQYALSPSACFHTYIELENKEVEHNSIFTFTQNVFRNEGRLNYSELGRFRDYHVREIVFVGDESFVEYIRKQVIEEVIKLVEKWKMNGKIVKATDPFVMPKMQKFKKLQMIDESKYECLLNVSDEKEIAAASFNLHGTAFSYPFNFNVKGCNNTVTGCVGFGLERWVVSFLSQYGDDINNWPESIRDSYVRDI